MISFRKSDIPEHLRQYFCPAEIGLEPTPDEFVAALVEVFREVRRVLRDDGTLWLNLGDSYARNPAKGQHKPSAPGKQAYLYDTGGGRASCTATTNLQDKQLIGIPWRVAFALQVDGWFLRQDIIWHKPNPMPESVRDRCTKAHEYIFLLSKSPKYFFDNEAIKEAAVHSGRIVKATGVTSKNANAGFGSDTKKGFTQKDTHVAETRNKRSVWTVTTKPFKGTHFATFPPDLIEPCILAGSAPGGVVLDPFGGAGTVNLMCAKHGRTGVYIDLNPEYAEMARQRCK